MLLKAQWPAISTISPAFLPNIFQANADVYITQKSITVSLKCPRLHDQLIAIYILIKLGLARVCSWIYAEALRSGSGLLLSCHATRRYGTSKPGLGTPTRWQNCMATRMRRMRIMNTCWRTWRLGRIQLSRRLLRLPKSRRPSHMIASSPGAGRISPPTTIYLISGAFNHRSTECDTAWRHFTFHNWKLLSRNIYVEALRKRNLELCSSSNPQLASQLTVSMYIHRWRVIYQNLVGR